MKSYNGGLNIADDGRIVTTLFHELQDQGWKTGTVTSVPFCHASPAGMYAQNVERDDYQDIARAMLGLPGIIQEAGGARLYPGLDVVIGTGIRHQGHDRRLKKQGHNAVPGNLYLTDADRAAIDYKIGGKYVCVQTETGVNGGQALRQAAASRGETVPACSASSAPRRSIISPSAPPMAGTIPFPACDKKHIPVPAEVYSPSDLDSQPTLAQMTEAALAVLSAQPE